MPINNEDKMHINKPDHVSINDPFIDLLSRRKGSPAHLVIVLSRTEYPNPDDYKGRLTVGYRDGKPDHVALDSGPDPRCVIHGTPQIVEQPILDAYCTECNGITATDVTGAHWHVNETACVRRGMLRAQRVKFLERAT
jgi:hypothetical protein